jgi:hypothetical protein
MARPYANENFPLPVVEELRLLGHDVLTIQEMGQSGRAMPMKTFWLLPTQKAGSC